MVFIRIMVVVEDMVVMADMVVDMVMEVEDIVAEDTEHLIKAVTGIKDQQTKERRDLLAMEAMEVVGAVVVTGSGHMEISLGLGQCFTIETSTSQPITWAIFLMDILYQ